MDEYEFDLEIEQLLAYIEEEVPGYYADDDKHEVISVKTDPIIEGHLNNPIIFEEVNHLLQYDKMYCRRHINWKEFISGKYITNTCNHWCCLEKEILKLDIKPEISKFDLFIDTCCTSLSIQKGHFKSTLETINYKLLHRDILLIYYTRKLISEHIKDKICFKRIKFGEIKSFNNFYYDCDLFLYYCSDHKCYNLIPTHLFIGVLDRLQCWFDILLYLELCDITKKYPFDVFEITLDLIKTITLLMPIIREAIYDVLKMWEPLITGFIIQDEKDIGFNTLYKTMSQEIDKLLPNPYNHKIFLLPKIPKSDFKPLFLLELSGLNKSFGYPELNVLDGLKKVREHAFEYTTIDEDAVKETVGMFVYYWSSMYLKRYEKYPFKDIPLNFPYKQKIDRNQSITERELEKFPISIWSDLKFDKVFEFDYCKDTIDLIKDSAICHSRKIWFNDYDHCAFKNLHNQSKPRIDEQPIKRTILRYLLGSECEAEFKIRSVDKGYYDIENDSIAVLCPKERELTRNHGRPFVKQTYTQRLKQTLCEENIKNQIMGLSNDQMMTLSELESMRRQQRAIKSMQIGSIMINIDFTKWNLKFRYDSLKLLGEKLDQIFGLESLYRDEHLWYHTCIFISNNRMCPPEIGSTGQPLNGNYCHRGHLGGCEGMNQKKWTLFTQSAIRSVAFRRRIRIMILGQGDNQVIMLKLTKKQKENWKILLDEFLTDLKLTFDKLGHKLKLEETWYSKYLFDFGKVRQYKGLAVSNSLKKISRLIPDINDGLSSWLGSLSTIITITESCAKGDYYPDRSIFVSHFETLNFLNRKGIINPENYNVSHLVAILHHPIALGGIPVGNYLTHFIRGYDDLATYWLDLIKYMLNIDKYKTIAMCILGLLQLNPNNSRDFEVLIRDIYALNIVQYQSIDIDIKYYVLIYLRDHVQYINPEIKSGFMLNWEESSKKLINTLRSLKPFFPALAHEIYCNSREGQLDKLQQRLCNNQTINKIVQKRGIDFIYIMDKVNLEFKEKFKSKWRDHIIARNQRENKSIIDMSNCAAELTQKIREKHWGIDSVGVSQSLPMCQTRLIPLDSNYGGDLSDCLIIKTSEELRSGHSYLTVGPFSTYLGFQTKQQKIPKQKSTFTTSLRKLITIKSWVDLLDATNLSKLILNVITDKCPYENIELNQLIDWSGVVWGGNLFHRFYCDLQRDDVLINHLPNIGSHIKFSSDRMDKYAKKGKDYTIFCQLLYLYAQCRILLMLLEGNEIHPQYLLKIMCPKCTSEITDIKLDLTINPTTNPMAFNCLTINRTNFQLQELSSITIEEANYHLSFHFGAHFSKEFNNVAINEYLDLSPSESFDLEIISSNLSQTDFRYINIDVMIISLLLHNDLIFDYISNKKYDYYYGVRGLITFAKFIYQEDKLNEFIRMTGYRTDSLSEMTQIPAISEFLLKAIKYYCNNNKNRLLGILLQIEIDVDTRKWLRLYTFLEGKSDGVNDFSTMKDLKEIQKINKLVSRIITISDFNRNPSLVWSKKMKEVDCRPFILKHFSLPSYPLISFKNKLNTLTRKTLIEIKSVSNEFHLEIKNIHHIGRPLGNIASSSSKFFPILLDVADCIGSGLCIFLAEGSGSNVHLFSHLFKNTMGYNTLLTDFIDNRSNIIDRFPPAIINDNCNLKYRFPYQDILCQGETDITTKRYRDKFTDLVKINNLSFLSIDAECEDNTTNILNYFKIWSRFHTRKSVFFTKLILYSDTVDQIYKLIENMIIESKLELYVRLDKPISSHLNNNEFYLTITTTQYSNIGLQISEIKDLIENKYIQNLEKIIVYSNNLMKYSQEIKSIISESENKCLYYQDNISYALKVTHGCSIICGLFINSLIEKLRDFNDTLMNNEISLDQDIVEKKSGANLELLALTKNLLFCLTFYYVQEIPKAFYYLIKQITFVIGARCIVIEEFFEDWRDDKIFFKKLSGFKNCEHKKLSLEAININPFPE